MKRSVIVLAAVALVLSVLVVPEPAAAGSRWIVGADFSVGGVHFSLGFHDGHRYAPRYYYRTQHRFDYRGYRCGSACYVRRGYSYHDRYCPVVRHHFSRHRVDPYYAWGYVQPGYRAPGYAPPPYYYDGHHRSYRRHRVPPHHYPKHHRHGGGCKHRW